LLCGLPNSPEKTVVTEQFGIKKGREAAEQKSLVEVMSAWRQP